MTYYQLKSGSVIESDYPNLYRDCLRLTNKEGKRLARQNAIDSLLKSIHPGQDIYTIVRSVSSSGMSRTIDLFIVENGQIARITHSVALATDHKQARNGALSIGGCGMDMCFQIVYLLGCALWPKGTPKPHGRRNGEPDSTGGYALNKRDL